MGSNLINYPDDCGTPTSNLLTVKLMFNSIISTPGAKFMTIDIRDFYLMTPMDRFKYFRMKLDLFPQDIIDEYGLRDKVDTDGNVFCKVRRGIYGLPQAGIIAQDLLTKRLHKAGYRQSKVTPGYWRHDWHPISFTLVVDDFGVKYINKATWNISSACYNKITKWTQIGTALNTLVLHCIGTTNTARYICPCPATLKKLQSDLDTNLPTKPSGNHVHIPSPPMVPPSNTPSTLTSPAQQQKTSKNTSAKSSVSSSTTAGQSIPHCLLL